MGAPQRYTKAAVEAALIDSRGMVSPAARRLGCTPNTVRNYAARYPSVQMVMDDQREQFLDESEIQLIGAVQRREPWAIAFTLSTVGRKRGYVKRTEIGGEDGGPVPHHHTLEMGGFSNDELRSIVERATGRGSTGAGTP